MHLRARELIEALDLAPHPEGGFYRQVFKSAETVTRPSGEVRSALTTIYFLLVKGTHSRWHRVKSDEVWHHDEGDALELLTVAPGESAVRRTVLGPLAGDTVPVHVVPAGWWQSARPLGDYTLVGCTVGPGFEFEDFEMLPEGEAPPGT
ncbi:MAG: cupin domain-containing protein [Acidobacteria bacterium]|nr:cupin domain-containing protein [Acidobacteriota bacterium]